MRIILFYVWSNYSGNNIIIIVEKVVRIAVHFYPKKKYPHVLRKVYPQLFPAVHCKRWELYKLSGNAVYYRMFSGASIQMYVSTLSYCDLYLICFFAWVESPSTYIVYRHHGGAIEDPPEIPRTPQHYRIDRFECALNWSPIMLRNARLLDRQSMIFQSGGLSGSWYSHYSLVPNEIYYNNE